MKRSTILLSATLVAAATLSAAHTGVTNPVVLARMDSMKSLGGHAKVLGRMAKGEQPFDSDAARDALKAIAREAAATPDLFEARETDPKSEARPVIWERWEDFVSKSNSLSAEATSLAASLDSSNELRAALRRVGAECQACHEVYRE